MEYTLNLRLDVAGDKARLENRQELSSANLEKLFSANLDVTYRCGPYIVEESLVKLSHTSYCRFRYQVFTTPWEPFAKDIFYSGLASIFHCGNVDNAEKCSLFIGSELLTPYLLGHGDDYCIGLLKGLSSNTNPLGTISASSKQEFMTELLRRSVP